MGVYVYCVIRLLGLCGFNELARHFIAVWTAGILGADGYLTFSTGKAVANASHVHAYSLRNARRQRGGTAVSHFLIYRDMGVHRALGLSAAFPDVFANAQQYAYGQLVIQESALYVPALCYPRPGLKANYVPNLYAEPSGILCGLHLPSALELVGGWALYKLYRTRWWDYTDKPFNIGGYVCLEFSLMWGVGAMVMIKAIHPTIAALVNIIPPLVGFVLMCLLYAVYAADVVATAIAASDLAQELDALEKVADSMHAVSDAMTEILGTTALDMDQKMDESRLQLKLAAAEARDSYDKLSPREAASTMRTRADEAMEAARRASQTARLNAAEAAKAVKLAAQGKAEQTTAFLQLEQLKEELAARAQVMQARTRRGTHLLGKGRMLRAYPKLKHGQSNRSLSSLLEQLEDEYPDSFNGFGIQ